MVMSDFVKTYSRKPKLIEAVRLTRENAYDVAIWCGGEVKETGGADDVTEPFIELIVPNVYGNDTATIGVYITRDLSDGRFWVKGENFILGEYEVQEEVVEGEGPSYLGISGALPVTKMGPLTPHYVSRGQYDRVW